MAQPISAPDDDLEGFEEGWIPEDTFATRLILMRRELGMDQAQAAARCGFKTSTWGSWELGHVPRDKTAVCAKIAKDLKVDRDWLAYGNMRCIASTPLLTAVDGTGKPKPHVQPPLMFLT